MKEKGSILIVSLWVLAALFLAALSLAFYAGVYLRASNKTYENLKSETAFLCGVNWVKKIGPSLGVVRVPEAWKKDFSIVSEDEESKLNLNHASGPELLYLFKALAASKKIACQPEETVKALIETRAHKPFEVLEEMLRLKGVSGLDVVSLKHYLTVYTNSRGINVNTASDLVLESVILTLPQTEEKLKMRIYDAFREARNSGIFFEARHLSPEIFMETLQLERTPEMNAAVAKIRPLLTADSRFFHLAMTYKDKRKAEVVIGPVRGSRNLKILFWHQSGAFA